MNARDYFRLTDSIAGAETDAELAAMRDIIVATPMHPVERHAVERVLEARAELLRRRGDAESERPRPERAD